MAFSLTDHADASFGLRADVTTQILVTTSGQLRYVYSEAVDLNTLGPPTIRRASHVDPAGDGMWMADLSPVNGPMLGPFALRSGALAAERQWLERNWLPHSSG